jgi:hypothetical protein
MEVLAVSNCNDHAVQSLQNLLELLHVCFPAYSTQKENIIFLFGKMQNNGMGPIANNQLTLHRFFITMNIVV